MSEKAAYGSRGNSWKLESLLQQAPGLESLSNTLIELTENGVPIVVGTADLKYSNGLVRYQERYPDRFFQFGISEQNMVSAAAGMASVGLQPFVATFASFMSLLCVEQMRTDTAYTNLPVRLISHHAGFTLGFYGSSHHATEDLAISRSIANMTVLAPADALQLRYLLRESVHVPGPVYIRMGRGREPDVYTDAEAGKTRIGKAITHYTGRDITVVATGTMVHPAREAVLALRQEGIDAGLVDMHTIKPLDAEAIEGLASETRCLLTVEEHNVLGGLGGAVAEVIAGLGLPVRLVRHGVEDRYVPVGPPTHLYRHLKLDAEGIRAKALDTLKEIQTHVHHHFDRH